MDEETLNSINRHMIYTYLPITTLLMIGVFYRVRMRLDPAMIFISLAYPLSFFFRLPLSFLNQGGKGQNPFSAIAYVIIFSLIYYFVFEMMRLRDKIQSDSHHELRERQRKTQNLKIVFYTIYFFGEAGIVLTYRIIFKYFNQVVTDH